MLSKPSHESTDAALTLPQMNAPASTPAGDRQAPTATRDAPRMTWVVAAVLITVFVGVAWLLRAPGITMVGDDALYLYLSESIRDFNYRETFAVGHPIHALYPPGYPALLALASLVVGSRPDLLVIVGILAAAGGLAVLWFAVRSVWGAWLAAGTLAVAALNPGLIHVSGMLMSEAPFFALVIVAVWTARKGGDRRATTIAIVAAIAAALTRTAGVTVIVAVFLAWLLDRRRRDAAILALCAALIVGPWLAWSLTAPNQNPERSYAYDAVAALSPRIRSSDGVAPDTTAAAAARPTRFPAIAEIPAALARRVADNAAAYASRELPWALPVATVRGTTLDNWLWLVVLVILGALGLKEAWSRWRAAALLLICYGALLLVWPWALARLLVPVVPLVLMTILVGGAALGRKLGRFGWTVPLVVGVLIAGAAIAQNLERAQAVRACDRSRATVTPGCFSDDARAFFTAASYVRTGTAPDARVAVRGKVPTFAYYARREVVPVVITAGPSAGQILDGLVNAGADYVLLEHLNMLDATFARRIQGACDRLELVRAFEPDTYLFRLADRPSADPARSGCAALAGYRPPTVSAIMSPW